MTEDGIMKICTCGKSFNCTDGNPFCSEECYDQWESRQEKEEEED